MTIDVMIPVFRPDERLTRCLSALSAQTIPARRIHLLVSYVDEQDKRCAEPYKMLENVSIAYIEQKNFDYAKVKAEQMRKTDAQYMLFMTQDAIPAQREMVERMLSHFEEEQVAAVYARHVTDEQCDEIERFTRHFNYPPVGRVKSWKDGQRTDIKLYFNSNVCAMYRLSNYRKTSGFEERAISCEDTVIAWKILKEGDQVVYAADAEVIHYHNYSLKEQFQRNFDTGAAYAMHPELTQTMKRSKEGLVLVKETAKHLVQRKKKRLLPALVMQSGAKYLGYQMGQHYQMLPYKLKILCTRNKGYWEKEE